MTCALTGKHYRGGSAGLPLIWSFERITGQESEIEELASEGAPENLLAFSFAFTVRQERTDPEDDSDRHNLVTFQRFAVEHRAEEC